MKILADSNVLVTLLQSEGQISERARDALRNAGMARFFSAASVWELEIKSSRGKLTLPNDWVRTLSDISFTELKIDSADGVTSARLPWHHRDPFDRMIVAHALTHDLTLVTRDTFLAAYGVKILAA